MGTATAPSTALSAREALASDSGLPLGISGSPRPGGLMEAPAVLPSFFDAAVRAEPSRVEHARRITAAWLRRRCLMAEDRIDALVVVVSELCTNAIRHGRVDEFGLRGRMESDGRVRLEVRDSPSVVPSLQHVGAAAESGRGLFLVDAFVTDLGGNWGVTPDGATAWCEVPRSAAPAGSALVQEA